MAATEADVHDYVYASSYYYCFYNLLLPLLHQKEALVTPSEADVLQYSYSYSYYYYYYSYTTTNHHHHYNRRRRWWLLLRQTCLKRWMNPRTPA